MEYTVIKRNKKIEPFDFNKIYVHMKRGCEGLDVDINKLIENFRIRMKEEMYSDEIQKSLYITASSLASKTEPDWQFVGARLLLDDTYKRIYGSSNPKFNYKTVKNRVKLGYYDKEILDNFTKDEFNELCSIIDFKRDLNFTYLGLKQMLEKYSIRRNKNTVETPQEIYFLISMYIFGRIKNKTKRASKIKKMYKGLSTFKLFLSTPPMVGIRSKKRGFTSCAGVNYGDSVESLSNATRDIMKLITKLNAGIGGNASYIRGLGADIANGQEEHTGITPYLKVFEATSQSSTQPNSGRNGSITNFYPFFHWEIEDILTLKNNKGSEESSVRQSDHAIIFNKLFYERLFTGKDITLFHINETSELVDVLGEPEKFEKLYLHLERKRNISKKKVSAEYLWKRYLNERYSTARVYKVNADEMQNHGAFELPTIASNLCLVGNTKVQTENGIKDLQDIRVNDKVLSMNIETKEEEFKKVLGSAKTGINRKVIRIVSKNMNEIICTPEHKIWTWNRGYVKAKDLKLEDFLQSPKIACKIHLMEYLEETFDVYDITVEDNYNFYANNILVHNCTEINLPSFPNENWVFLVKKKKKFENWIEGLYDSGTWFQLYRFTYYNIIDDENKSIIKEFNKYLDPNGVKVKVNFGEIFSCILGGINLGSLSTKKEQRRKELKDLMSIMVNFLDDMIDYQDYADITIFEKFTKNRRALGISPGNYFHMLAKYGYDYDSEEARRLTHEVMEEMLYYGILASTELAEEKGACKYFNDTKYSKGIFPIDTYNKNIDTLLEDSSLGLDWDYLRAKVKENGMRNSTILTAVPSSNSSRPANMISGINPPQALEYNIEDQKMKVSGLLPDLKKYKGFYERHISWDLNITEYWKDLAIFQKFIDQAISINEYIDFTKWKDKKIPQEEVIKRDLFTIKYGFKTLYYAKTKTDVDDIVLFEEKELCSGGGCTL